MASILGSTRTILSRSLPHHVRRLTLQKNQHGTSLLIPITSRLFSTDYPPHTLLTLPALSPTMETGRIAKWNKEEGESFVAGDVICEIETDKATVDFEAQDDGIIAKILLGDIGGDEHKVGVPIAVVVEEEADKDKFKDFEIETAVKTQEFPVESAFLELATEADTPPPAVGTAGDNPLGEFTLLPSARHLSQSKGVDATVLYPGSGKGGRVTKGDVLVAMKQGVNLPPLVHAPSPTAAVSETAAAATPPPTPAAAIAPPPIPEITDNPYEDIPNNNMRKVIAKRLTESKATVPHFYTTAEVDIDPILSLRKTLAAMDVKVSVNDVIVRASALALRDVPEMNAMYKGGEIKLSNSVDICIAVATPTGLITPIVPKTDELGLAQVNAKIKDLATRARDNKLKPEEYQGGTFTISNLGMFGIDEFTAVINPPQCAILAVGGGVKKVTSAKKVQGEDDQESMEYGFKTMMSVRLSADRRVVDEPTAGLFLQTLSQYLQKPNLLML